MRSWCRRPRATTSATRSLHDERGAPRSSRRVARGRHRHAARRALLPGTRTRPGPGGGELLLRAVRLADGAPAVRARDGDRTFYRRRISRIFPAHYGFVGTVLLCSALRARPSTGSRRPLRGRSPSTTFHATPRIPACPSITCGPCAWRTRPRAAGRRARRHRILLRHRAPGAQLPEPHLGSSTPRRAGDATVHVMRQRMARASGRLL